jgi:hypothetical protein
LFFPIAVQTLDYFVYVTHHNLFGMWGVTNHTLTSDGHLSEQSTAVAQWLVAILQQIVS